MGPSALLLCFAMLANLILVGCEKDEELSSKALLGKWSVVSKLSGEYKSCNRYYLFKDDGTGTYYDSDIPLGIDFSYTLLEAPSETSNYDFLLSIDYPAYENSDNSLLVPLYLLFTQYYLTFEDNNTVYIYPKNINLIMDPREYFIRVYK